MNKKILAFIYDGRKFLALRNNSKDPSHGGDFWFSATGSLEKGETEKEAVKREVKEETGLDVLEIFDLNWGSVYFWGGKEHKEKNFIAFVRKKAVKLSVEHAEYEWLTTEEFVKKIKWYLDKKELIEVLKRGTKRQRLFDKEKIEDYRKIKP